MPMIDVYAVAGTFGDTKQLATDLAWAGRGVGSGLLKHALQRCAAAAALIGGRALLVRAVDMDAAELWQRRQFIPSINDPLLLFRAMSDVVASVEASAAPE